MNDKQSNRQSNTLHYKSLHTTPRSWPTPLALLIADLFFIIFVIFIVLRPWHIVLVVRLAVVLVRLALRNATCKRRKRCSRGGHNNTCHTMEMRAQARAQDVP